MNMILNSAKRVRHLSSQSTTSNATAPVPATALEGTDVKLVGVDAETYAQTLFYLTVNEDNLWDYMGYGPFKDANALAHWMDTCATSTDPVFYVFLEKSTNTAFGMASYLNIRPAHGSIEIGNFWLTPNVQRTTIATQAIYIMMAHAMDILNFRRLEWKCNALNAASRRAAKRYGFSYEGTFYNHLIIKGKNRDTAWFSITAEEWPAIKAGFETWLAPGNFDKNGQQKISLTSLTWD